MSSGAAPARVGDLFNFDNGTGGRLEARLLMSPLPFSARYDLDRRLGIIIREGHPLRGQSVADVIFAAPGVQGGVAAGWALRALSGAGVAPVCLVFDDTNPVMVQGAVLAGIPVLAGDRDEFFSRVKSGSLLRVDGAGRRVEVLTTPEQI